MYLSYEYYKLGTINKVRHVYLWVLLKEMIYDKFFTYIVIIFPIYFFHIYT